MDNKIKNTKILGLLCIEGLRFVDHRGSLLKPFSQSFFEGIPELKTQFKETWFTKSKHGVIRAMHMQIGDFACEKLVTVIQGRVLDIVLDLRKDSKTFGQWHEQILCENDAIALYIPVGCAHGYKVLEDNTITMYMATEINIQKDDVGVRWDSFGYDWKITNPIISERDKNLPILNDITF